MKKRHAFTLVELLVVIGIIALLISILLPALNRARWQAQLVTCAARMRDVTMAAMMYANDNKNFLPPRGETERDGTNDISTNTDFNNAYEMAFTYKGTDIGQGLGRLYRTKYLKVPTVYQCPSAANPSDPYTATRAFTYYHFNPHVALFGPTGAVMQHWWKRITNYGRVNAGSWKPNGGAITTDFTPLVYRRAIMVDAIWTTGPSDVRYLAHARGKTRAFNLAYADGSVRTLTVSSFAARTVDRWRNFIDLSNALQYANDGGDVDFRGAWTDKYNQYPVNPQ